MPYKHVIWDWNGTLMDDGWLCVEIMNSLLARRGLETVEMDFYRANFQFPVQRYYDTLGFDSEQDPFSVISHEFIDAYELRRTECQLYPGVVDALARWHEAGVEQVILSAYRQPKLIEIVAHYGLSDYFDRLIGLDNIYAEGKTGNAQLHAASIPHEPHELLLIGDTVHDFEVAEAIGADCLLIAHGHNDVDRLRMTGSPVVESLAEIIERIDATRAG
ncbi:HAD family hydrolase [Cerasicoccus arenae]|uniref:phosphoglycolate phosphatase n=1 Tax=Cerasicoccus arenae TaxID=424488 RepID=A0A8J3DGP1_9BACT|nr:HAD family hydrolase [Cerasicoccus arenae]MBK1858313.1 HAD family hydrolase [Cerasicoccus arenae]GHB90706.1 putative phosphatase [Cerasicoccus arenae]